MQSHLPAIHHADMTKMKENPSWFQAIPQTLPTPTHISDENASEARGGGVGWIKEDSGILQPTLMKSHCTQVYKAVSWPVSSVRKGLCGTRSHVGRVAVPTDRCIHP